MLRCAAPWRPHVRFRRVQTLVREGSPLVKGDELTACTSGVRVIASDHYLFAGERPAFQFYLGTQSQTVSA
jgi:hypothetical protein